MYDKEKLHNSTLTMEAASFSKKLVSEHKTMTIHNLTSAAVKKPKRLLFHIIILRTTESYSIIKQTTIKETL
jgi:hypothetical protein